MQYKFSTLMPLFITVIITGCASVPGRDQIATSPKCFVANDKSLFSTSTEPEASTAKIKTGSGCLMGLFGCKYALAEISGDGVIRVADGDWSGSNAATFGILTGNEIQSPLASSASAKVNQVLVSLFAQRLGPIVIDRQKNEVQFPKAKTLFGNIAKGEVYYFANVCTNEQVAVGTAAIELLQTMN